MVRSVFSAYLLGLAGLSAAFAHGRFHPDRLPDMPGFNFTDQGFRVRAVEGDFFKFDKPLTGQSPVILGNERALWRYPQQPLMPLCLDFNLAASGFSSYWPQGFALHLGGEVSPRITVEELTVDSPNPTPLSKWVLISFVQRQAPVLFVFDRQVQTVLTGEAGNWVLTTLTPYQGWVHTCLPLGQYRINSDVQDLGATVSVIDKEKALWLGDPPRLTWQDSELEGDGVTVTWSFDRPGAVVPPAILLAQASGYPITVQSPVMVTKAELDEGPQAFTEGQELKFHVPVRSYAAGAPLFMGATPETDELFWPKSEGRPPWLGATEFDLAVSSESADYWSWSDESDTHSLQDWAAAAGGRSSDAATVSVAAMLHVGSLMRTVLNQYRSERGFDPKPVEPAAPFTALRQIIFGTPPKEMEGALTSPLRAVSLRPIKVVADKVGYTASWTAKTAQEPVRLTAPWSFDIDEPVNVGQVTPSKSSSGFALNMLSVAAGPCSVHLTLPTGQSLPTLPQVSRAR